MRKQLLINLLKSGLGCEISAQPKEPFDWPEVYRMAAEQGVAAIAWDGLQRLITNGIITNDQMPDKATKLKWALATEQTEKRYNKQYKAIVKLSDIYAKHNIKMLILKGYGLSILYPRPEHRSCCDIDIWLFGEQERADNILRDKLGIKIDEDKHHHTVFHIDGVMVENHYDFLNIHAHASNKDIEARLKQLAETPDEITIEERVIYRPNANCHALFLLRHAAAHFAAVEIVLRHIIDWAMFVKHQHQDIDWAWLREVCRQHNMELFLDAMNALAAYLCDIEISCMPGTVRRPELEKRILNDIIKPEFSAPQPQSGLIRIVWYKFRRWWANRWKHRIVYRDGLARTFLTQTQSHIAKPKSIKRL